MSNVKAIGTPNAGYLKKQIRDQDKLLLEIKKIVRNHANVINEHAKFINTLIAENKKLTRRLEKLEYNKRKLIIT